MKAEKSLSMDTEAQLFRDLDVKSEMSVEFRSCTLELYLCYLHICHFISIPTVSREV